MGCIPARHIPAYLTPDSIVDVYDESRTTCFPKDYEAIIELCDAGQIWGSTKGARLRYVVLMVPIAEMRSTERARQAARSASDAIAQDNRTVQRGRDITALHYDHNMRICRAYGSTARQAIHRDAAKLAAQSRIIVRNRPAVVTFTQRASLAAQIAIGATA